MYIPEQSLLVLLLDKNSYNLYKDFIDLKAMKETYRELSFLFQTLVALHEKHETSITLSELSAAFFAKYPDSDKVVYGKLFETLQGIQISPEVGQGILADVRRRKGALRVSEVSFKVAQGLATDDELRSEYAKTFGDAVDHGIGSLLPLDEVTTDLELLIKETYADQGLRWRLDCLNKSLGSLRPGDFGFIFARPETGKTTFLASEAACFVDQAQRPVVWFNNEEQGNKVMLRIYQAYFGVPSDQLLSNPKRFATEFNERTGGRLKLFDAATISKRDVESIVSKLNPELVIYDQLPKIKGFSSDRDDLRLGAIFQWARELAKGSHAAIGVSQADGHAENVRYLTMEHVANAKTAVQAEADWILGIGKIHDDTQANIRFLNISKNKLLGDKDSMNELRHGKFEVIIEPHHARYRDIIKYD